MVSKLVYIETIGCQMNVYDSGRMAGHLAAVGYTQTDDVENADLIIVNTCSIRQKAEQKAFSFLGRLAAIKERNPELIVGIGGCVAQQEGKKILSRMPHVDLVFGTRAINRLPKMIQRITSERCRIVDVEMIDTMDETAPTRPLRKDAACNEKVTDFVTIMRGCDNFCTYCVVPYVRGRECSRTPETIIREIEERVHKGIREVTLLGQNVNSYGKKEGWCTFPELLARVNRITGLERIRFTTSHPKDLSEPLMRSFVELEKLCHHFHLPVQSGSNAVLKKMNRKYTRESYLDKLNRLRTIRPDIAVTTDIIVGFPGESEEDFHSTMTLIREAAFDGLFAFIYSDRPNAPAAGFPEKVPEPIKKERLQQVLKIQERFTLQKHQAMVGTRQCVLVEGKSKKEGARLSDNETENVLRHASEVQWTGRTATNKIVNFTVNNGHRAAKPVECGRLVEIIIEEALPHSLWGYLRDTQNNERHQKGDQSYAA